MNHLHASNWVRSKRVIATLFSAALLLIFLCSGRLNAASDEQPFSVVEASIPDMQQAMEAGQITSRELVEMFLVRIALYEERVNAVIAVNPNALADADRLDAERAAGQVRGPLHGIPIALKDNIHTTDMPTTGGALVFRDFVPPYEATLTSNLRNAGAIIIAKTVMTELANFIGSGMPGNYSAIGGYGLNPYDPRRDPREGFDDGRPVMGVGGSSSGIGTAMSFWAANVGTETSGSILSPANANMLAAIKPTVGRISRWGIIPITADQDTAGPMARSVTDAAILLGVLESTAPDPQDPATSRCEAPANNDYTPYLQTDGLRGARIGIPRAYYYDQVQVPGSGETQGGLGEEGRTAMQEAIDVLRQQGAIIVDAANIPSVLDQDPQRNLLTSPPSSVLSYGMKRDFNAWLATLGATSPVSTLTALREWNLNNEYRGGIRYGQARLDDADALDLQLSMDTYQSDRARDLFLNAEHGIDEVMTELNLDALLFPASSGAGIAARPGYPTVIVPFSRVTLELDPPLPQGFDAAKRPFGVSFTASACSEARLIQLAYSFEQATRSRIAPPDLP